MRRPAARGTAGLKMLAVGGGAVALSSVCGTLPAQAVRPASPAPTWHVTASAGLVGREIATWTQVHQALAPTGWDSRFPSCIYDCADASDNVDGRPLALTASLRRRIRGPWQVRLLAARASAGRYPGAYVDTPLTVTPRVTTLGAQAVHAFGNVWLAAGPSWYHGFLHTRAGPSLASGRRSGVGAVLSAGATFPRASTWFMDLSVERRFAGSVTTPLLPVPGSPDVPALTTGLSATVLSAGIGWRH